MYPLDMTCPALGGFAVANDANEHRALSEYGYMPAFVEPESAPVDDGAAEPVKRGPGRPKKVG